MKMKNLAAKKCVDNPLQINDKEVAFLQEDLTFIKVSNQLQLTWPGHCKRWYLGCQFARSKKIECYSYFA